MDEPIRERESHNSTPLEYRSGKDDYNEGGPQAGLAPNLAGLSFGLLLNSAVTFVCMVVTGQNSDLVGSAHFVCFAIELSAWYHVARL